MSNTLINKYNVPGPRYTSYPTVPYWSSNEIDGEGWMEAVKHSFSQSNLEEGISLYIHLPFCESLCTFCACHKRITKRHEVEAPYISTLLREWHLYRELLSETPRIKEIHLGGGTPTFFDPIHLEELINGILATAELAPGFEFSFEGHPNNTTKEHLQTLFDLGFRRTSFGVQDYDSRVQHAINRIQPFERVETVHKWARKMGYESISHDLVFGLPHQGLESITRTIELTRDLKPDRLAFYSYAHVPWIKNVGQRGFDDSDLPSATQKRELYQRGKKMLQDLGYIEIVMDHFALESDSLHEAMIGKTLHRNFMGYTSNKTQLMIGLGMSSISDSWHSFAQNSKSLEEYSAKVNSGQLPIFRGHSLSAEDLVIRRHILNIMCQFETSWKKASQQFDHLEKSLESLHEMEHDGLLTIDYEQEKLILHDHARPFVRNVCMAFDLHMLKKKPNTRLFSMTI